MKTRFNDQANTLKSKVKAVKGKFSHKTPEEYQRLSRYVIVKIGNVEKLVVPSDIAPQNMILANDIDDGTELSVSLDVDNSTVALSYTYRHQHKIVKIDTADRENNVNVEQADDEDNKNGSSLNEIPQRIQEIRDSAKQSLENQADKMLKRSNAKFTVAKVS
ncbi:hypothetical protein ILUMI_11853 [Ignelater luminosus]|uniref:Uncharacterized protein n=1 Tax=Ignelater luminosus TaxID=2038154 RepID=A0A8K0CZC7_IGNLU|nr:hypothetical protein ILUMI_11853 [Ignelater luminosus]